MAIKLDLDRFIFGSDVQRKSFGIKTITVAWRGGQVSIADVETILSKIYDRVSVEMVKKFVEGPKFNNIIEVKSPADWWEHFKQRWFPDWAIKRWPVKMLEQEIPQEIVNVCPHIHIEGNHNYPHIDFLVSNPYRPYDFCPRCGCNKTKGCDCDPRS